jgi:HK97 family phage portal protein
MFKFVQNYINKRVSEQLETWSKQGVTLWGDVGWTSSADDQADFTTLATIGFKRNPSGYACITLTSNSIASLPWAVWTESPTTGEREEINSGPLVELLKRPNPQTSQATYFKTLTQQLEIGGEAYQYFVTDISRETGQPIALRIPPGNTVTPRLKGDTFNDIVFDVSIGSAMKTFDQDEMLQIKYTDPLSPLHGTSPLESAFKSLRVYNNSQEWLISLLRNSGRMSNAWVRKFENASLTPDAKKAFEEWLDRMHAGPLNAGRDAITDTHEPKPLAYGPMDMGIIDLKKDSKLEICSALGVPPMLIGDLEKGSTFSNFEQAVRVYFNWKIIPTAQIIRDELNIWLAPKFGTNLVIDFDPESIQALAEDADKQAERLERLVKIGIQTLDESRQQLGLDPLPFGGDEPIVDATRLPLASITGEEPAP